MFELYNSIRDYHWGSASQITDLLGLPDATTPQAEMWLGAHDGCPSTVAESGQGLNELINQSPSRLLGDDIARRYGRLPYLMKVLSAAQPLSIQVHPTLEQAKERFAAENAAGKPLDAADRNYRDDNHKPEMLYALTDFTALSGFRAPDEIAADVAALRGRTSGAAQRFLGELLGTLQGTDPLEKALHFVLEAHYPADQVLDAMMSAISSHPELRAVDHFATLLSINEVYPQDRGLLVALMLNLVRLRPGEAISLAAGNVHAYLQGLGIEVMANSDNVLRGGLTSKHIDVPELLDVALTTPTRAPMLTAESLADGSKLFRPSFEEFQLHVISADARGGEFDLQLDGAGIVLCTAGSLLLHTAAETRSITRGQSVFIGADELPARVRSEEAATVFAASAQAGAATEHH